MVRSKGDHIKIGRVACIECGHCMAICPTGAISDETGESGLPLPETVASPEALAGLIQRRRTVRQYKPDAVPRETLEAIIDAARWVPTAANCQAQQYVVIAEDATRDEFSRRVADHYRAFADALTDRENREAKLAALDLDAGSAMHEHILAAVPAFVKSVDAGRDRLLFGAPVAIVIHADRGEVMPQTACDYATLALALMAEAHGLGTCITGYASEALQARADLREWLGIPAENQVYQVLVVGWPDEEFPRVPDRAPAKVEWK